MPAAPPPVYDDDDDDDGLFADSSPNLGRIVVACGPDQQQQQHHQGSEGEGESESPALQTLRAHGAVILRDSVPQPLLDECRAAVGRVTSAIVADARLRAGGEGGWSSSGGSGFDDPKVLNAEARRGLGITRIAHIGAGKKNVHFDPYVGNASNSSSRHPHAVMEALAKAAGVEALIKAYCGEDVTVAETGLSITRPGGGGLEWHADGRAGECTVIMSVDDLPSEMGKLGVILGSHEALDRDTSEDFDAEISGVVEREARENQNAGKVSYAYRAGQPIVVDARTLHAAEGSSVGVEVGHEEEGQQEEDGEGERQGTTPKGYRVILWWIYNGVG